MTYFEALCDSLNVKKGSKYEIVVSNMVNDLIFDENRKSSRSYSLISKQFLRINT